MEFKRTNPDCTFTIPDRITVRMQMQYFSMATIERNPDLWERLWVSARKLIQDWQCSIMPDKEMDLEEIVNPQITSVLIWASSEVRKYINSLDSVPKN